MVQLSHLYMTTGKTIALTIWTFVSTVMSVLFFPFFLSLSLYIYTHIHTYIYIYTHIYKLESRLLDEIPITSDMQMKVK